MPPGKKAKLAFSKKAEKRGALTAVRNTDKSSAVDLSRLISPSAFETCLGDLGAGKP